MYRYCWEKLFVVLTIACCFLGVHTSVISEELSDLAIVQEFSEEEMMGYQILDTCYADIPSTEVTVHHFFWYSCGHCFEIEEVFEKIYDKYSNVKRVNYQLVAPPLSPSWERMARVFYALESLDRLDLHQKIFASFHVEKRNLYPRKELQLFLQEVGVSWEAYEEAEKGFNVDMQLSRASHLSEIYGLQSVPSIVVQGKYLVTLATAGSSEAMGEAVTSLIEKLLAELPMEAISYESIDVEVEEESNDELGGEVEPPKKSSSMFEFLRNQMAKMTNLEMRFSNR